MGNVAKLFKCSICGSEVPFSDVMYIRGSFVVCRKCFPRFYVSRCPFLQRRLNGENVNACRFCQFKKECDQYVESIVKQRSG